MARSGKKKTQIKVQIPIPAPLLKIPGAGPNGKNMLVLMDRDFLDRLESFVSSTKIPFKGIHLEGQSAIITFKNQKSATLYALKYGNKFE